MALSLQRYTRPDEINNFTHLLKQRNMELKQKSMLITLEKIDCYLPDNLIIEILSRLSVKDLLQFKSVCKSWFEIISSPIFVSKHLTNYYNNNDEWRGCLLAQFYLPRGEIQLYELLVDETETPRVLDYDILSNMPMYCSYVWGPCDGLYYVYQHDPERRALWNPAINELKKLPEIIRKPDFPSEFGYAWYEVSGFGFDRLTGDYKVVVMKGYSDINFKHPLSVLVYSLRTNSWRYCGDLAKGYDLENNTCYIYVNGCCYWLGSFEFSCELIISFDMSNDTFKEIDVPDYAQPSSKCLAVYDDSLVFLSLHWTKNLDIWTWSEGCWTKKFSVGPLPRVWGPVGHWKDNRIVLQSRPGELVLYHPDTQETEELEFENSMQCKGVYAYMESLVSIKDKNEAGQQSEEN
ncbi:F-box domain-containing protein [Heracleum sosnowskyi]|uniref:F-box domain-containing protein n=1 Tax=Heracleum sosnowskyi TaxID=360622 RepID=A0AAD8GNP3_9APIA|nr:F-box domain-containing protein [Heracleum sosnowskyi]